MQYNKIKLTVGLFTIVFFILTLSYIYIILSEKGLFTKRYNYHFNTTSASNFSVGMPVKFSGFNIGIIDNVSLQDNGTVHMTFSVSETNRKWVRDESVLVINKPLIGSPYIEIYSNLDYNLRAEGSTLTIFEYDDINDMINKIQPVIGKVKKIINNIDTITSYIARGDSEIIKILKNIEKFSAKLANDSLLLNITGDENATQGVIDSLEKLNKSMQNINKLTKNLSVMSASLNKKIIQPSSESIKILQEIMKDVQHKLNMLDGTVAAVGNYDKDLIEVKEQISIAIEKSNQIIGKVDEFMSDKIDREVQLP